MELQWWLDHVCMERQSHLRLSSRCGYRVRRQPCEFGHLLWRGHDGRPMVRARAQPTHQLFRIARRIVCHAIIYQRQSRMLRLAEAEYFLRSVQYQLPRGTRSKALADLQ